MFILLFIDIIVLYFLLANKCVFCCYFLFFSSSSFFFRDENAYDADDVSILVAIQILRPICRGNGVGKFGKMLRKIAR